MTKSEMIIALAGRMNLSIEDAKSVVETIIETITDALVHGQSVELRGFGRFHVREYEGYAGRNPRTGEQVQVRPKRLPFFRVSRKLGKQIKSSEG